MSALWGLHRMAGSLKTVDISLKSLAAQVAGWDCTTDLVGILNLKKKNAGQGDSSSWHDVVFTFL